MLMNDNEINKIYLEKIKLIQKYNKFYYNKSSPIVTDYEFDQLKKEILDLEKKYSFLKNKNSPSFSVGFAPQLTLQPLILEKFSVLFTNNTIKIIRKNVKISFFISLF